MAKLTALTGKTGGANSGAETLAQMIPVSELKFHPDFQSLFSINPVVLSQIVERMKNYGFDKAQPILLWVDPDGNEFVSDGHTRLTAAKEAGIEMVPVCKKRFNTIEEAMEYTIGLQTARRNLTDAEIATAIIKLDQLKNKGRIGSDVENLEKGKSAAVLAKKLDISTSKVEKFRAVEKKASDEVKQKVLSGELSINAAYQTTRTPVEDLTETYESVENVIEETKTSSFDEPEFESVDEIDITYEDISNTNETRESSSDYDFDFERALDSVFKILVQHKHYASVKLLLKNLRMSEETQKFILSKQTPQVRGIIENLEFGFEGATE